jgi:hypothetical protein
MPRRGAVALLDRPALGLIGDTSYSLYLWHWPILVIAAGYAGHRLNLLQNLLLVLLAFGISYLTFRFFENPLRHARALRRPRVALAVWPASLAAVIVTALAISASFAPEVSATPSLHLHAPKLSSASLIRSGGASGVHAAVAASVTPRALSQPIPAKLAPAVAELRHDVSDVSSCAAGDGARSPICHWGDPRSKHVVVVIGDSHAQMWVPGFLAAAHRYDWNLIPLLKIGCVPANTDEGTCGAWYRWVLGRVRMLHPQAVVLSQFWSSWGSGGVSAMAREIADMAPVAGRLFVVQDAPFRSQKAVDCLLARGATRGSCTFPVPSSERTTYADVRAAAMAAGATYVPVLRWLCAAGKCPAVVGNVITYRDDNHVSKTYADLAAAPFARAFSHATT